ncbi:MAG: phosphomethylpyrimidine kinase [Blastococcus sp.]|jgi:hydroxymethylpyrimidine/phosphomethylpyrimidine kinase|nr:phosphomethylpyrimidine kinase [Blastococcus sp.]
MRTPPPAWIARDYPHRALEAGGGLGIGSGHGPVHHFAGIWPD